MLFFDKDYYPTDQTGDQGDSSVRAGIMLMTQSPENIKFEVSQYEIVDGYFARHPSQEPWNNFNNFSRDQMMPLIAGLNTYSLHEPVKRHFYARMKKFFFSQNIERDKVGSRKYLRPHYFYKDSIPNADTWFGKDYFDGNYKPKEGCEYECKMLDGPDLLFINHVGALILAGKVWPFAPLLVIAYPVHILSLLIHALKKDAEQNQMIAECAIYKTTKVFKAVCRNWEKYSEKYWAKRNEIEYHQFLKWFLR